MKYAVHVKYYIEYTKELTIYAADEAEAEEKAIDIVSAWKNISDDVEPEVTDIFEE
jgi:hypothetical protein